MSLHSYGKVWNLGNPNTAGIFDGPVIFEEKVDGSQFSFGVDRHGQLHMRTKRVDLAENPSPKDFALAAKTAQELHAQSLLPKGLVYRAEFLRSPKHNSLKYGRVPKGHLALFDVDDALHSMSSREFKESEAVRLGIDVVPVLHLTSGPIDNALDMIDELLKVDSYLGGTKIEGVVIKASNGRLNELGQPLYAKFVSEAFKEVQKDGQPKSSKDIVAALADWAKTERRWEKSVESMRDDGVLANDPKDIGELLKRVQQDVEAELEAEIKDRLWKHFRKEFLRGTVRGLPEWYKRRLVDGLLTPPQETVA